MLQKSLLTVHPETKKELVGKMDTNYVLIKSFSKGIKVILDSECSFDELLEEIEFKFLESAKFFKGSKISVSFEGRKLSLKEEKKIIQTMEANGNMSILYVCGQDDDLSFNFAKAVDFSIERNLPQYFGKVYEGSLKKGQRLECETGVIVFGDVNPGAEIVAEGSIIVLGGLYGSAISKKNENPSSCFIYASNIDCENLRIGEYKYYSKEKGKWLIKPKMTPKIAYVNNEQVEVLPVSSDILKKILLTMDEE